MTTPHDTVVYPNLCLVQTHPDRLGVIARLFGLESAHPSQCRVLEIGCGDGNNLLPLAAANPGSRFFGFDLAGTRVEAGRKAIAELGLTNLELQHLDLLDFPLKGETFDYIIAHGVYSWVAPEAREQLLAICRSRLNPAGVAFISYNCLPGCHIRRMAREIMRFHVRAITDPGERVRQALAVCQFIANSIDKPDTYQLVFKEQLAQIQKYQAGHLFHDDLAEINDPVYFFQFVEQAARHGLQYLGEAEFFAMQHDAFSAEARQILAQMDDSRLTQEQYLDFAKCRRFRQTLLCHGEVRLELDVSAAVIQRFHISSKVAGTVARTDPGGQTIERFAEPGGGALEVGHPLGIRALHLLAEHWPATLQFQELFEAALGVGTADLGPLDLLRGQLAKILLEAYRAGLVDFRLTPVRCAAKPSAKPAVSRFARWQLTRSATVTTLRGDNLRIDDEEGKRLLLLLDGTRTLDGLEECLRDEAIATAPRGGVEHARLEKRLEELARLALLEPEGRGAAPRIAN